MKSKVIHLNREQYARIKKIMDDKAHIHQKIKEGKFSEINSAIKFVKAL